MFAVKSMRPVASNKRNVPCFLYTSRPKTAHSTVHNSPYLAIIYRRDQIAKNNSLSSDSIAMNGGK